MKLSEDETQHIQPRTIFFVEICRLLLAFGVMAALALVTDLFHIPNPNMLLITGLVVFTSLYGFPAGILCSLVMLVYSLYFFSTDHSFIHFTDVNIRKMLTILLGVVLNTIFVGKLKQAKDAAVQRLLLSNQLLVEDNSLLERASMVDTLTGVRNRFALQRDAAGYENQTICLMMLDVDNFKGLNDTYGHKTGDMVLSTLGETLNARFGAEHCYRFGGDEFLVVHNQLSAAEFSQQVRRMTAELSDRFLAEHQLRVTFSAGYVFGRCELPGELHLMLRHADNKLYESKKAGKNRCLGERYRPSISERYALTESPVRSAAAGKAPDTSASALR